MSYFTGLPYFEYATRVQLLHHVHTVGLWTYCTLNTCNQTLAAVDLCLTAGAAQAIVSWSGHSLMQEYLFLGDMPPPENFWRCSV